MDSKDIQKKAHEIVGAWMEKLNSGKSFADLMQVYGDIRVALSRNAPDNEILIDTYTELMAKEQKLFSPETAFQAGRETVQSKREYAPLEYIRYVMLESKNISFLNDRDALYHTLCGLTRDIDLMDEYNELFRYCHGEINWKIEHFYHLGYYGKLPEAG